MKLRFSILIALPSLLTGCPVVGGGAVGAAGAGVAAAGGSVIGSSSFASAIPMVSATAIVAAPTVGATTLEIATAVSAGSAAATVWSNLDGQTKRKVASRTGRFYEMVMVESLSERYRFVSLPKIKIGGVTVHDIRALGRGTCASQVRVYTGSYTATGRAYSLRNGAAVFRRRMRLGNGKGKYRIPDVVCNDGLYLNFIDGKCMAAWQNMRFGARAATMQYALGSQAAGFAKAASEHAPAMGLRPRLLYGFCNVGPAWVKPVTTAAAAAFGVVTSYRSAYGLPAPIPPTYQSGMLQGLMVASTGITSQQANDLIDYWIDL